MLNHKHVLENEKSDNIFLLGELQKKLFAKW